MILCLLLNFFSATAKTEIMQFFAAKKNKIAFSRKIARSVIIGALTYCNKLRYEAVFPTPWQTSPRYQLEKLAEFGVMQFGNDYCIGNEINRV